MDQALSGELLALPEALDYNIKYVSICQHFSSNFFDLFPVHFSEGFRWKTNRISGFSTRFSSAEQ